MEKNFWAADELRALLTSYTLWQILATLVKLIPFVYPWHWTYHTLKWAIWLHSLHPRAEASGPGSLAQTCKEMALVWIGPTVWMPMWRIWISFWLQQEARAEKLKAEWRVLFGWQKHAAAFWIIFTTSAPSLLKPSDKRKKIGFKQSPEPTTETTTEKCRLIGQLPHFFFSSEGHQELLLPAQQVWIYQSVWP